MRHAATLLEFVAALTVFSLLVIGLQSSVSIAVKSIPSSSSPIAVHSRTQLVIDMLAADLETATYISELTNTSIAFAIADRNGDGLGERIRYAWNGVTGGPLSRQLNDGTPATILSSIQGISFKPQSVGQSLVYPSPCIEDTAESLLIDQTTVAQVLDHDVSTSQSLGQRFTLDLPVNAYAWRPTRVQFQAKLGSIFGISSVQLRSDTATCNPSNDILQQLFLNWLTLNNNYSWQSFSFAGVDPLPSSSSFSVVLQRTFSTRAATLASSDRGTGLLKGNAAATAWELQDSRGLVCQLYGKLWRSTGTRSTTVSRITAIDIALQAAGNVSVHQATIAMLNEPVMATNQWQLDFASNPTLNPMLVDSNADGVADWALNRPGTFNLPSISAAGWQTSGDQLVSNQDWNFNTPTIIDLTAQCESSTSDGAVLSFNALRSGSNCVPLAVKIKKQSDCTQSVFVQSRPNDSQWSTLVHLAGQNNVPLRVRLIIDPTISAVSIYIGNVTYGTFGLTPYSSTQTSRRITLGAGGSPALFQNLNVLSL